MSRHSLRSREEKERKTREKEHREFATLTRRRLALSLYFVLLWSLPRTWMRSVGTKNLGATRRNEQPLFSLFQPLSSHLWPQVFTKDGFTILDDGRWTGFRSSRSYQTLDPKLHTRLFVSLSLLISCFQISCSSYLERTFSSRDGIFSG